MTKIYHYAFNVFNDRTEFKVVLRQLSCKEGDFGQGYKYIVTTPFTKLKLRKCDIGQVHHGKSVLMFERNDEKAIKIFNEYLTKKINESQEIVNRYTDIVSKLNDTEVREEDE